MTPPEETAASASSTVVVAVVNQKGGVAKTTTVTHLAAAFAERGRTVLVCDLDPQASLTFSSGIDPDAVQAGTAEALLGERQLTDVVVPAPGLTSPAANRADLAGRVDVVPATEELSGVDAALADDLDREYALRAALGPVAADYDLVLIDCSPTLGLTTLNALAAAHHVVVPVSCDMLSHRGVGQLLDTVRDVRDLLNPQLTVSGLLPTMFDARLAHARAVLADLPDRYQLPVLPPIPRSVRFAEAPAVGKTVLVTAPRSAGATAYRDAATRLAADWGLSP